VIFFTNLRIRYQEWKQRRAERRLMNLLNRIEKLR
jgi:hypothetical protein